MGLNQGDAGHRISQILRSAALPAIPAVLAALLALGGEPLADSLSYNRAAISGGEIYRLLSGHFVHLGLQHLLLNLAGLVLVWVLVGRELRSRQWTLVTLVAIAIIDGGFWVLQPQLHWYVGLSGLLHAWLAAGLVSGLRQPSVELIALAVLLVAKLVYEALAGPLPGSEASSGGNVIVAAHLYGAFAGTLAGIVFAIRGSEPRSV